MNWERFSKFSVIITFNLLIYTVKIDNNGVNYLSFNKSNLINPLISVINIVSK